VNLDPSAAGGFSAPVDRWIEPTPYRTVYTGRVAVLTGPVIMSSAEAFLLMMKQAQGCTLVGARSYGASGNPKPHVLSNGVTVMLPSWKAMLPDGTVFETKGIAPDVEIAAKPEDFVRRDPVIEKALEALKR
jgi:carboxyl-terminal processing protease